MERISREASWRQSASRLVEGENNSGVRERNNSFGSEKSKSKRCGREEAAGALRKEQQQVRGGRSSSKRFREEAGSSKVREGSSSGAWREEKEEQQGRNKKSNGDAGRRSRRAAAGLGEEERWRSGREMHGRRREVMRRRCGW